MTKSKSTLFSLTENPLGPDGQPLRRSERLKIIDSKDELFREHQKDEGINYERRVLYNPEKKKFFKLYAVKALDVKLDNLWPGRIVKAVDCYPQTSSKANPYDGAIGKTTTAGPIAAKFRYMIVVWRTDVGVAAIPLYTLGEASLRQTRMDEYWETIYDDVGRIEGGEYSRLMDLLTMKEREFRTAAFAKFDTNDNNPEPWSPWRPGHEHQPKPGVRYADAKTRRMSKKKFQRV
ncbi:hypothetical protein E4T50_08406 [Aureobasidium sp. EXF-12298]|nr:hypothetical protein E4T50_08406 [Aureobasidium sp. EXF-12298]KAI4755497.1 hypothetical protein E4T51_11394 [Aureobasidium sp. EXF-12344]KAI4772624.1 hypothetical protein E4T52_12418 [Aureobasidium sp. EXF-3400]